MYNQKIALVKIKQKGGENMGLFSILSDIFSTAVDNHKRNVRRTLNDAERNVDRQERSGRYSEENIARKREAISKARDRYER